MSERWPGLMRRTTAARYCELTLAKFERAVATGELPMPVKINGEDRCRMPNDLNHGFQTCERFVLFARHIKAAPDA